MLPLGTRHEVDSSISNERANVGPNSTKRECLVPVWSDRVGFRGHSGGKRMIQIVAK